MGEMVGNGAEGPVFALHDCMTSSIWGEKNSINVRMKRHQPEILTVCLQEYCLTYLVFISISAFNRSVVCINLNGQERVAPAVGMTEKGRKIVCHTSNLNNLKMKRND